MPIHKRHAKPSAKEINRRNREVWALRSQRFMKRIEEHPCLTAKAITDMADREKFPKIQSVPSMEFLVQGYVERAIEQQYYEPEVLIEGAIRRNEPKKAGRPPLDVRAQQAIQLHEAGMSWDNIAELFKTNPDALKKLVKRFSSRKKLT